MARLNLLPWRAAERERQKRLFLVVGGLILGGTLLLAVSSYRILDGWITTQQSRNDFLGAEMARLDRKLAEIKEIRQRKADVLARIGVIHELQLSRPEAVHLLDEILTALPPGVFLTGIKQTDRNLVLQGRAQSYGRVSELMHNLKSSAWLTTPSLKSIELKETGKPETDLSDFELHIQQQRPPAREGKGPAA